MVLFQRTDEHVLFVNSFHLYCKSIFICIVILLACPRISYVRLYWRDVFYLCLSSSWVKTTETEDHFDKWIIIIVCVLRRPDFYPKVDFFGNRLMDLFSLWNTLEIGATRTTIGWRNRRTDMKLNKNLLRVTELCLLVVCWPNPFFSSFSVDLALRIQSQSSDLGNFSNKF